MLDPRRRPALGDEPPAIVAAIGRPTWKADGPCRPSLSATPQRSTRTSRVTQRARPSKPAPASGSCSTPPVAATPRRGGHRPSSRSSSAAARIPPPSVGRPSWSFRRSAWTSPRASRCRAVSGPATSAEGPQVRGGAVRQAGARRPSRPAQRPVPANAGPPPACSEPMRPGAGAWTGRSVAVCPRNAHGRPRAARARARRLRDDPRYWAELRERLATSVGRPTRSTGPTGWRRPYSRTPCATPAGGAPARRQRSASTSSAKGSRPRRGAQDQQRARTGAPYPPTRKDAGHRRDGAGQHGVATATACALLGLPCVSHMGTEDIQRQASNVGCGSAPRSEWSRRLADPQGRDQRGDARVRVHERRDDPLRARIGDGSASVSDDRPRPPAPD